MKTKMYFFLRGIVATVLLVTFSSFAMAANTSNQAVNNLAKAKTTMVFNDTGTDMNFTVIIMADLAGDKQARNFVTNYTTDGIKMENTKDPNIILYDVKNATIHTATIYPNFNGAKDVSMYQNQEVVNVTDVGTDLRFKENVDTHQAVPNKTSCNRDVSQDLRNENEATQSIESYGLVFSPHKSSAIITVKFIDVKSLGDIIPQNDNMIVASRKFRDQTTNGLKVSTHFTLQDLQDFNLS